ncbi:MAG TPA: lysophospholipid acyltransferase family protein, partial [Planctomycetota bacterium]|nr:lysophospholipid acyltransferase family protein [Planctomycetota bacterium]
MPRVSRPLTLKRRIFVWLAVQAGYVALRLLAATWRHAGDFAEIDAMLARGERWAGAFWHNRILCFVAGMRGRKISVLISRHSDGEIIARLAEKLGYGAPRGSSTRGGVAGLKALVEAAGGGDIGVTPDGPRGPRYSVAPGIVLAALATGRKVLLATCAADRAWRLRSWDAFVIPKPFARITFRFDFLPVVEGDLDDAAREALRLRIGERLRRATAELEDAVEGRHDPLLERDPGPASAGEREKKKRVRRPARARALALLGAALGS